MSASKKDEDFQITKEEFDKFHKAMQNEEFRKLLLDYAEEISDPENKKKYEEEISQMERERGMDIKFVNPEGGFVVKTTRVKDGLKAFVNICHNEHIQKASSHMTEKEENGVRKKGEQWSIPFSLSQPRDDLDNAGKKCVVFDVVFHPDTYQKGQKDARFKETMISTALDGIYNQLNVKLSSKNLKFPKLKFKGVKQATVIRTKNKEQHENVSDNNINIGGQTFPYPYANDSLNENKKNKDKDNNVPTGSDDNTKEKKITETNEPIYHIVHRGVIDFQNFTNARDSCTSTRPKELVVTIELPKLKSTGTVELDIFERQLVLHNDDPHYHLDLALPYPVDDANGQAKFDKSRRELVVTLPVIKPEDPPLPHTDIRLNNDGQQETMEEKPDEKESLQTLATNTTNSDEISNNSMSQKDTLITGNCNEDSSKELENQSVDKQLNEIRNEIEMDGNKKDNLMNTNNRECELTASDQDKNAVNENRDIDGDLPGNDGDLPGNDGLIPGNDGAVAENDGDSPEIDGAIEGNDGDLPGNDGLIPENDGAIAGNDGDSPENDGAIPGNDGDLPGNKGDLPGNDGILPGSNGILPGSGGILPGSDGAFVLMDDIIQVEHTNEGVLCSNKELDTQDLHFEISSDLSEMSSPFFFKSPPYSYHQDNETVTIILHVAGVAMEDVSLGFNENKCYINFPSEKTSRHQLPPPDYALYISFAAGHILAGENCHIDVSDDNLVITLAKDDACKGLWDGFKAGPGEEELEEKFFITDNNVESMMKEISKQDPWAHQTQFAPNLQVGSVSDDHLTVKLRQSLSDAAIDIKESHQNGHVHQNKDESTRKSPMASVKLENLDLKEGILSNKMQELKLKKLTSPDEGIHDMYSHERREKYSNGLTERIAASADPKLVQEHGHKPGPEERRKSRSDSTDSISSDRSDSCDGRRKSRSDSFDSVSSDRSDLSNAIPVRKSCIRRTSSTSTDDDTDYELNNPLSPSNGSWGSPGKRNVRFNLNPSVRVFSNKKDKQRWKMEQRLKNQKLAMRENSEEKIDKAATIHEEGSVLQDETTARTTKRQDSESSLDEEWTLIDKPSENSLSNNLIFELDE